MAIKCVVGDPKTGKSKQFELEDTDTLMGKQIGDKITLSLPELSGYEFIITGGSDSAGFPMRFDVDAPKRRILAVKGIGLKNKEHGKRVRKTVAGRMITQRTAQLNLKVAKYGSQGLFEEPKVEEESPAEEKKEE